MTGISGLISDVESTLIRADAQIYYDLATLPHLKTVNSVAILPLMPFLSAFVLESAKYSRRHGLVDTFVLSRHAGLLSASRIRVKFLDDRHQTFEEIINTYDDLATIVTDWMYGNSWINKLKRLLQPDLGILFLDDKPFITSHVAFVNFGIDSDAVASHNLSLTNLGPHLKKVTTDFGSYLGQLSAVLGMESGAKPQDWVDPQARLGYRDTRSRSLYRMKEGQSLSSKPGIPILLSAILCQINAALYVLPLILPLHPIGRMKIGFLTLYHASSSLQKVLNANRSQPLLDSAAAGLLEDALRIREIRGIRRMRRFRNTLMHYAIDHRDANQLVTGLPLNGLIESNSDTYSMETLSTDIEYGLSTLSLTITTLFPQSLLIPNKSF